MNQLNRNLIQQQTFSNVTVGVQKKMPERVLQFGEGNFLRAFVDWQFNEIVNKGLFEGSIVVVQPLPQGMVQQLNEQDGVYTVVQRGYQEGKLVEKNDVVTVISRGINPYTEYQEYLKCASNPDLRYIISNTTESGIEYVKCEMPSKCPNSYPAKVAILLYERFKTFKGDNSKGLLIIPCELIEKNGDELKRCVLQHAADWNCGDDFIVWVEQHNHFYNTLVDRIVPGFPRDEVKELYEKFGYEDKILVACEVFHKWVIQGNPIAQKELPFTSAGLNVVWADDVTPHRTLKVRILNGAHTTFTIPSFLSGNEFVKESMEDSAIGTFIHRAVFDEILPTLNFDQTEKERFANAVLERFKNPFIKHALISISLNSVSKYKVRVLPSLLEYYNQKKVVPKLLAFGLAAIPFFYKPVLKNEKGFFGSLNGKEYPIQDSADIVEFFENAWKNYENDMKQFCSVVLSNEKFWGINLAEITPILTAVVQQSEAIRAHGIRSALEKLLQ